MKVREIAPYALMFSMTTTPCYAGSIDEMAKQLGPEGRRVYRLFEDELKNGCPKNKEEFEKMKKDDIKRIKKDWSELGKKTHETYLKGFKQFIDICYGKGIEKGDDNVSKGEYSRFLQSNKNSAALSACADQGILPEYEDLEK